MALGSTILVKDVLFRVSTVLKDMAPSQFVRWTERELIAWLNDAQRAIAKYMPASCTRIDSIKLARGTRQSIAYMATSSVLPTPDSPVRGIMLLDIIRNMGADGLTPGRPIRIIPRESLDNIDQDWHSTESTVVEHFSFDPRMPEYFYTSTAVPVSPDVWVEVAYAANPDEVPYSGAPTYGFLGASMATISVEDRYVDDLVNYIAARAYLKDSEIGSNAAMAQLYATLFMSSLNAQTAILTGVNPNIAFLPFAPEPMTQAR